MDDSTRKRFDEARKKAIHDGLDFGAVLERQRLLLTRDEFVRIELNVLDELIQVMDEFPEGALAAGAVAPTDVVKAVKQFVKLHRANVAASATR
jgi:hypothetical protein